MKIQLVVPCVSALLLAIGADRVLAPSDAASRERARAEISALRDDEPPEQPGALPERWASGVDCEGEAPFQVLADILEAAEAMAEEPRYEVHDHFVLHPVWKVGIRYNG